ncbi:LysR family transcriptional regulator [Erwiniaceae bacterium CAU 1747]
MELRHLRYFVAVAEEKNFSRAALRLHISQPPLSRQIQQLEAELGVVLLVHGSRPLQLTEAGHFFYQHARQFLAQSMEMASMTRRIGQIDRSLVMGCVASTLYGIMPRLIRRFRARYPQVDVTLLEMTTMEQLKALKEGTIDIGLGRIRHEEPGVRRIVLREEPLMVAMVSDHPLAAQPQLVLRDLQHETLLVYPQTPRPSFADQVLALFRERALEPQRIIEVRELQMALGLVASGVGISLVPECLHSLHRQDVLYKPLSEEHLVSPIIMSTRLLDQSEDIQRLLAMIYQLYDEEKIDHIRPSSQISR